MSDTRRAASTSKNLLISARAAFHFAIVSVGLLQSFSWPSLTGLLFARPRSFDFEP